MPPNSLMAIVSKAVRYLTYLAVVVVLSICSGAYSSTSLWAKEPNSHEDLDETPYREMVRFHWKLEGFSGGLLRIFPLAPSEGTGILESRLLTGNRLDYRFRASFVGSPDEDFWIFRSIVDLEKTRSLYVHDLRKFRGKQKIQEADLTNDHSLDIISGIHWLKVTQPNGNHRARAWADSKMYWIEIVANGFGPREVDGRTLPVEHYTIRGIKEPGEPFWKPTADIWIRADSERLPIEVLYQKGVAKVRLTEISAERPEN
jgi:hypothetical protein